MTERSCFTCPSFMKADDMAGQIESYSMTLGGVGSCPRTGRIISGPTNSGEYKEKVAAAIAKDCKSYGSEMPPAKNRQGTLKIALPLTVVDNTASPKNKPSSCRSCKWHIGSAEVRDNMALSSTLCTRYGKLIADQETTRAARQCPAGEIEVDPSKLRSEQVEELLGNLVMLPELRPMFSVSSKVGAFLQQTVATSAPNFEPSTYPTDKPLTDDDKARGIRAWQSIKSTDQTREVFLPIFDRASIPADDQDLIPATGDDNSPNLYVDHQNLTFKVAVIWQLGETPALHGVAGTGKTEFFRYMAWRMQLPFHRVSITASSELDDLAGKTHYHPEKGTFFEQGRIPRAWQSKCIMVLDEPNVGPPDVWQFVRPMTDNAKQLVLDMNEGQKIDRNPSSFLGMAMNPAWDFRNKGAEEISDADGSRLMHIFVEFPSEKLESQIIQERCKLDGFDISKVQLKMVMTIAKKLRALSDDQTLPITWGIRQQIKVARALAWFDPTEAYRLAAADYIEPEARAVILDEVIAASRGGF